MEQIHHVSLQRNQLSVPPIGEIPKEAFVDEQDYSDLANTIRLDSSQNAILISPEKQINHALLESQELVVDVDISLDAKVTKNAKEAKPSYLSHSPKSTPSHKYSPKSNHSFSVDAFDLAISPPPLSIPPIPPNAPELIEEKEKAINSLKMRLRKEGTQIRLGFQETEEKLQREIIRLRQLLTQSQEEINRTEKKYTDWYKELSGRCEQLQIENESLKKKIKEKEESVDEKNPFLTTASNDYVVEIQNIHETLRQYKNEIATVQTKLNSTNVENEKINGQLKEIENEMASQREANNDQLISRNQEIQNLTRRLTELEMLQSAPPVDDPFQTPKRSSRQSAAVMNNRLKDLENDRERIVKEMEVNGVNQKIKEQLELELSVVDNYIDTLKIKLNI